MSDSPRAPSPAPNKEILSGIGQVAREHLGIDTPLDPEASLVDDLELDSIRLLTLAVEVENRFQVALLPEDEAAIRTVGDLAAAIAGKLEHRALPCATEPAR